MPSVLVQFRPSRDSTSGEGRIFSRFFNEYRAVTTPTSGEDPGIKPAARSFPRGESRISERAAVRCRCHRHLPRPPAVDGCGRAVPVADSETRCEKSAKSHPKSRQRALRTRRDRTQALAVGWIAQRHPELPLDPVVPRPAALGIKRARHVAQGRGGLLPGDRRRHRPAQELAGVGDDVLGGGRQVVGDVVDRTGRRAADV